MPFDTLQTKVATQIKDLGKSTEDKVVDALVNRELNRRSDALVQAIDKLSRLEKDLDKKRPDQTFFAMDGEKTELYSKSRKEERDKLSQQIDKLTKAISKALDNKDFGDVYQLISEKDQGKGSDAAE